MFWERMSAAELTSTIEAALKKNTPYAGNVLGFPGSFLDGEVFPDAGFLSNAPFLRCLRENPNHIGCHTLTAAESAFSGTQAIEVDLIRICAEQIAGASPGACDGYVASGGTECNIQAMWVQRNELRQAHGATPNQIAILCSEDTHYSVYKAADLLGLDVRVIPVDRTTRAMRADALADIVEGAVAEGKKYFSCILNMGTTMFGSIDDPDLVVGAIEKHRARGVDYRLHVDAAFGGFLYPFSQPSNRLSFRDPRIVSMTMDAHKMLQAPYGTGIFLVRKGMLPYVCNEHAAYVHGKDYTLCGSRSGANAIAAWMILRAYGSEGGKAFVQEILGRTDRLCRGLDRLGIRYFREPHMNIVTMPAEQIPASVAHEFTLVPDSHEGDPQWWKIVVMDHVTDQAIDSFLTSLAHARTTR